MSRRATIAGLLNRHMIACLVMVCVLPATTCGQERADAAREMPPDVSDEELPTDSDGSPDGIDETQRQQYLVSILIMLLAGVGIVGIAMIGAAMIWGAHIRRIVRHVQHPPTKHDELWYLRHPQPDAADSGSSQAEEEASLSAENKPPTGDGGADK